MMKIKVISLLILNFILQASVYANHTDNAQSRVEPFPHGSSDHSHEEPSIMSKIASWIFPFGSTDESAPVGDLIQTEASRRYDPQYLPPQQQCNPCNQEPWIPIASRQGHSTVIGFVPPGHSSPSNKYGPPSQHTLPSTQYGEPSQQYDSPSAHYGVASHQYGLPPAQYKPPTQQYGPPPSTQYGPVPQQHSPPPSTQYGLPQYQNLLPLYPQYGPAPSTQYGLPIQQYGSPPSPQNGPPTQQYGPPPSPQYGVPLDQQGYHSDVKPNVKPPPNPYQLPTYFVPPPPSKHKNLFKYSNRYKPPVKQSNQYKQHQTKPKLPPPLQPSYHGPPIPLNFDKTQAFETTQALSLEFKPPSVEPEIFKSYASVLTNYNTPLQVPQINSALTYQTSIDNHNTPIYANNENPRPGLIQSQPSYSHTVYNNNNNNNNNHETVKSVQLIPSIRIADFVSSIEHPINIIESPIVEVLATNNDVSKEEIPYESNHLNQKPIVVDDTHVSATAHNATYFNLVRDQNRHNGLLNDPDQSLNKNPQIFNFNSVPTTDLPIVSSSSSPFNFNFNVNSQSSNFLPTVQINRENLPTSQSLVQNQNINEPWIQEVPSFSRINEQSDHIHSAVVSTENPHVSLHIQTSTVRADQSTLTNFLRDNEEKLNKFSPTINFGDWTNVGTLSTAMVPPPVNQPLWSTTKKPKHVQIIIPYKISDVKGIPALLPLYTQPPSADKSPVWTNFAFDHTQEDSKQVTVTAKSPTESVMSIQEFMAKGETKQESGNDFFRLQKNIDDWTEQEFSNTIANLQKSTSTIGKLIPSKKIPNEYLITRPYSAPKETTTTKSIVQAFYDHESSSSVKVEKKDVNSNLISTGSTLAPVTLTTASPEITNTNLASMIPILSTLPNWEKLQLSISPFTKEKIYVVTPQPWKFIIPKEINDKLFPSTEAPSTASNSKLAIVIKNGANQTTPDRNDLKVIYSEWPHLINKLITTTTEEPKSTGHPLFGLMDLTSLTPPPNVTEETHSGHSKVITLVTPASTSKSVKKTIKST